MNVCQGLAVTGRDADSLCEEARLADRRLAPAGAGRRARPCARAWGDAARAAAEGGRRRQAQPPVAAPGAAPL